jgi:hypothetical protein
MAIKFKGFFEEKKSTNPALVGGLVGVGIYSGVTFLAPAVFEAAALSIANSLSSILGSSLGLFIGYLIPFAAMVITSAMIAMGLHSAFTPEPASKKGLKAGQEFLRGAFAKFVPGGRDAVDKIEDIAGIGMDIAQAFK